MPKNYAIICSEWLQNKKQFIVAVANSISALQEIGTNVASGSVVMIPGTDGGKYMLKPNGEWGEI